MRLALVRVTGRSMEPTLREGDLLLALQGRPPRPGDIAVLRLPPDRYGAPRPVSVKRLIRRETDGWWIDSDNAAAGVTSFEIGVLPERDVVAVCPARVWPRPARLSGVANPDPGGDRPGRAE